MIFGAAQPEEPAAYEPRKTDLEAATAWRIIVLLEHGVPIADAEEWAYGDGDLERFRQLCERGCAPTLALRLS